MKKQIRKAMLCTVAMMLIAVVTLTGVTYAWFSESDEATVGGLDMNVIQTEGGVYISTDGYDRDSFTTSIAIDAGDYDYNPVSTAGEYYTAEDVAADAAEAELNQTEPKLSDANVGYLKFFSGTLEAPKDTTLRIDPVWPGNVGTYIEQDVYFDNSTGATDVWVSLNGTTITPIAKEGAAGTKPIHLATRVAVVVRGSLTLEQHTAGNTYNATPQKIWIFENDATEHTTQGKLEYEKIDKPNAINGKQFDCYGLKAATALDQDNNPIEVDRFSKSNTTNFKKMTTYSNPDAIKIKIPAGSYLMTTLYVWIEGQDADCQNDVSGQKFSANVKYTITEAPAVAS